MFASNPHPRPWHRGSVYGEGPRRPLDREQRARFRFLLTAHTRNGNLTDKGAKVGEALLKRLSINGQCDPSHGRLADDVSNSTGKCSERTVRRALAAMRDLGLLQWQRRIQRDGWAARQASNAYVLVPIGGNPPESRVSASGGHSGRETLKKDLDTMQLPVLTAPRRPGRPSGAAAIMARVRRQMLEKG